jgi:hypothetical protein
MREERDIPAFGALARRADVIEVAVGEKNPLGRASAPKRLATARRTKPAEPGRPASMSNHDPHGSPRAKTLTKRIPSLPTPGATVSNIPISSQSTFARRPPYFWPGTS